MRLLWYGFLALFSLGMLGLVGVTGAVVYVISSYGRDLPDYSALKDYEPPVVTRVYAGDGHLLAEFASEKRVFVPVDAVPDLVKQSFISAEDQHFYEHQGVDFWAVARALASNLKNAGSGKRPVGASTITQQVAKNFLLGNEVSYKRKIREALLAFRMERALSKDRLLELYLNEIYLGDGAYGVTAAALNYFGKPLDELRIEEAAYLAALPKAPANYHPVRHHGAALARRNWVIDRMAEDGHITKSQAEIARASPLAVVTRDNGAVNAPYFAEEIRRELREKFGEDSLYKGGLTVRASVDPHMQKIAAKALRDGLTAYDKRHGWRGVLSHFEKMSNWQEQLAAFAPPPGMPEEWKLAVVLKTTAEEAQLGFIDGKEDKILDKYIGWAKKDGAGTIRDVLKAGDVIMVALAEEDGQKVYGLRQIPKVNGAVVAMDPHTGRVLAMQGGWSYEESEFNRATQAKRQPGSAFKPFVYLAGLENGFTPATLVLDAPIVIDQGPGMAKWRPTNYKGEYFGPTTLRVGLEKSRNLMTVRLADHIGMDSIIANAEKFSVVDNMQPYMSYALGAGETTLLQLTTGYAQLVNGGKRITPTFVDRIQDRRGKTVYNRDLRPCQGCGPLVEWRQQPVPEIPDAREQIADARMVYQIVSMMEGVVQRGTAAKIKELGIPLGGKTGTTNESKDTWFVGFSPDLVVGVFVGFDEPKSLGKRETGSSCAVPVFYDFMKEVLADAPPVPFRVPPGIRQVQINADTGTRAKPGDKHVIWEAFVNGTEPTDKAFVLDGMGMSMVPAAGGGASESASTGTGGLY